MIKLDFLLKIFLQPLPLFVAFHKYRLADTLSLMFQIFLEENYRSPWFDSSESSNQYSFEYLLSRDTACKKLLGNNNQGLNTQPSNWNLLYALKLHL